MLRKSIEDRLTEEVEGTCAGRFGYIISVEGHIEIGQGVLQPTSGLAEFHITYTAIVFKPFKNEVVDGIVTTVNKVSVLAEKLNKC